MSTEIQTNYAEGVTLNADVILAEDAMSEYTATLTGCVEEYDVQIANATNEMQEISEEKSETRADQTTVNSLLNQETKTDEKTGEKYVVLDLKALPQLSQLAKDYGMSLGTLSGSISKPEVKVSVLEDLADKLETKLDDLNSTSELKMISFQALIDSRKQALLQLSNLYKSSSDTTMEIIRNMK